MRDGAAEAVSEEVVCSGGRRGLEEARRSSFRVGGLVLRLGWPGLYCVWDGRACIASGDTRPAGRGCPRERFAAWGEGAEWFAAWGKGRGGSLRGWKEREGVLRGWKNTRACLGVLS